LTGAVVGELTMPKLSDSMADAVILRWLKAPGESFKRGDALIEVETDKATVVYEAEAAGTIVSILVPEGSAVAVGEPIATLANGDPQQTSAQASVTRLAAASRSGGDGTEPGRSDATPVARRTAVELGVSLHGVVGTGPGGRITRDDVRQAAEPRRSELRPASAGKGETTLVELTPTQATIARRMAESAATIPVFTVSSDIDVSTMSMLRREARDRREEVPSINDFIVKAAALVLAEFPRFNASWHDGQVALHSRINVGVAVATEDVLLVPVVRDADLKSTTEIADDTRRLADAARRRELRPDDLSDGTFTVSNLGMFGARAFTAIIDPPQVAILAVGAARRAPAEDAGAGVAFRDVMTVTLACDHRVVYGADGARFLSRLRELLESPLVLLL
jgi:pyruvate dehydrogenase E2 component (dihydrolipoamide acetyltransferase)